MRFGPSPSFFMSFGINFLLSFRICFQILSGHDIWANVSDSVTSCQSQSPSAIDFVWQPLEDLLESGGELSKITLLRSHIYALQLSLLT